MAADGEALEGSDDEAASVPVDGRRARAERNREAVVDAMLALHYEGNPRPGAAEIAERAGVSLRSVFRHFDDLETLRAVAVERHAELMTPLFEVDLPAVPEGADRSPVADRIDALVRNRAKLFEAMSPVRLVAERYRETSAALQEGLDRGRRVFRSQTAEIFDPELRDRPAEARRVLLDSLEAANSYPLWRHLRVEQGLSVGRASAVLAELLTALARPADDAGGR